MLQNPKLYPPFWQNRVQRSSSGQPPFFSLVPASFGFGKALTSRQLTSRRNSERDALVKIIFNKKPTGRHILSTIFSLFVVHLSTLRMAFNYTFNLFISLFLSHPNIQWMNALIGKFMEEGRHIHRQVCSYHNTRIDFRLVYTTGNTVPRRDSHL